MSSLNLLDAAVRYLDITNLFSSIKEKCTFYQNLQDKAFHFIVPIEPCDLLDLDVSLGCLVLHNPVAAAKIFQEVIYTTISTLKLLPKCSECTQVVVTFKLEELPSIDEYHMESSKDFMRYVKRRTYIQYHGVVCGISTITKYTKVARFVCSVPDCPGSDGDRYIRLHVPGAREAQTIRKDFKCAVCSSPLQEDVSCRVLADKLVVEMMDAESFTKIESGRRHQSLVVYLRDDLVTGVEIGQSMCVIGRPVLDIQQGILALEANSSKYTDYSDPEISLVDQSLVPESINALFHDRNDSPWSFGLSLAYAFADHIASAGTYLHLKLGLLLSLVYSADEGDGGLDLLIAGCDTLILNRLLDYAGTFSKRHIVHNPSSPLTVAISKDRHGTGACFYDGGSILMANNGICIIHDLDAYKKQTKHSLLQAIENNKVLVEVPKKLSHQGSQTMFLPRRCSVWATVDLSSRAQQQQLEDVQQVDLSKKKDVTQALADVFGMMFFADVSTESYADCLQTHQTLLQAMGTCPTPLISDENFRQFLHYARTRSIDLSEASKYLIRGYYVASRRVRTSGLHMWTLPITAIKAVTSLAEAHAKLCLHCEVTECDAVIAILLYEECVTARSGQSVLGVKPLPHIKDNNLQKYIGQERDKQLDQFHKQIKHFISLYATDVDMSTLPEE